MRTDVTACLTEELSTQVLTYRNLVLEKKFSTVRVVLVQFPVPVNPEPYIKTAVGLNIYYFFVLPSSPIESL